MREADRERLHEQHQHRHVWAHEHAVSVNDQAAGMHRDAAEFFAEYDKSGKADRERDLADHEAQAVEADRGEAAALAATGLITLADQGYREAATQMPSSRPG